MCKRAEQVENTQQKDNPHQRPKKRKSPGGITPHKLPTVGRLARPVKRLSQPACLDEDRQNADGNQEVILAADSRFEKPSRDTGILRRIEDAE
jgi:hypothetical protein